MRRPYGWLMVLFVLVIVVSPLGSTAAQGTERPDVRVLNAAPDFAAADFYLNDIFGGTLNYGEAAPYLVIPPGTATVRAVAPGAGATGTPLFEGTFTAEDGQVLNAALVGSSGNYQLVAYPVDRSPLAFGQSRLSIVHAVVGGATVNLTALAPDESMVTLASDLAFGGNAITEMPAGNYIANAEGVLSGATLSLNAGTVYTVFLIGAADGSQPITTWAFPSAARPEGASSSLRIVHAAPGAPALNLYLNDTLVAPFMDFGETTVYLALPPGGYNTALYATGTSPASGQPVLQIPIDLPQDTSLTGVVMGDAAAPTLMWFNDDVSAVPEGQSRLTVFNAQANPLSVTVDGQPAVDGMLVGQLSEARLLAPTPHTLVFSANGSALATLDNFLVSENTAFTLRTIIIANDAPIVLAARPRPAS